MTSPIVFVLVGTRSPGNLGMVCRAAKAFGHFDVRLVVPRFEIPSEEARRLAHGAEDVLEQVRVFASLSDAVNDCFRSVATTARPRDSSRPVLEPWEIVERLSGDAPTALVFGPEDRGLTNEELADCDGVASIALPDASRATLSLPAAAIIFAHELSRPRPGASHRPAARSERSSRGARLLGADELGRVAAEIEATLDEIGFRPRPNRARFRGSLRDFLSRARTTQGDRFFLRHVFAQVGKWKRRIASEARAREGRL
jgi:tRNA/rRNA methyltransferase